MVELEGYFGCTVTYCRNATVELSTEIFHATLKSVTKVAEPSKSSVLKAAQVLTQLLPQPPSLLVAGPSNLLRLAAQQA